MRNCARKIDGSRKFSKGLKRKLVPGSRKIAEKQLDQMALMLARDENLSQSCHDHGMTGRRERFRDCHIRPDIILIHRKPHDDTLEFARLGSHGKPGFKEV